MKTFAWIAACVLACTVAVGCSQSAPGGLVEGQLTVNGEAYQGDVRVILLDMITGAAAAAYLDETGSFATDDRLPPGEYVVFLSPAMAEDVPDRSKAPKKSQASIPGKYWNEASSPWKLKVEEGMNQLELAVGKSS